MTLKESIKKHSLEQYPKEACGLIIKKNNKLKIIPCKNESKNPENHFIISKQITELSKKIGVLVGFYHSHKEKDGFGLLDKFIAEKFKLKSFIYCLKDDKLLTYEPKK